MVLKRLKQWLPSEAIRIGRHVAGYGPHFRGNFATWEEACAHAEGYAAPDILKQVLQSALTVREGRAAFERDGVLFETADDPYPLLAGLMRAAALSGGNLRVVDFGGSLGSTYFQCQLWLRGLASLAWNVVEQPHYVEAGRKHISDGKLAFFTSIAEAAGGKEVDVVVFSSVLQYLADPQDILAQAVSCRPRFIIIDRTPVIAGDTDIVSVQKQHFPYPVPCSYPVRLFSRQALLAIAEKDYMLMSEFAAPDEPMGGLRRVDFKGFIFERRT